MVVPSGGDILSPSSMSSSSHNSSFSSSPAAGYFWLRRIPHAKSPLISTFDSVLYIPFTGCINIVVIVLKVVVVLYGCVNKNIK